MLRGDVWQVDLDPARSSEANKQRPAVVVSNDRANVTSTRLGRGAVTVVPIASSTTKVFPFQVLLSSDHTGFTGTTLWMDPGSNTYVVVLANVIHQRGGPPIADLSGEIATETARALKLYGS
ncbi:MAG TPA: type II toxin-antitoxin system PemK/MazF family toxin [Mycobacterium sp.]|nr:type II toxin-antitoxin system PemK/MazF family toxin [Mycobacterium sp.]